jgi:DNA modification methylase
MSKSEGSSRAKPVRGIEASTVPETFNSVIIGDSRQMLELKDETVDLVVTSPPYFSIKDYSKDGYQSKKHSASKSGQLGDIAQFDEFIAELLSVWRECFRVLKPNGKLVINTPLMPMLKKVYSTHENRHIFDLNAEIQSSILTGIKGAYLMDTYIWDRLNPTKSLMFGSYPYPANFYAQNTIEFVTVYVKEGPSRTRSDEQKSASKLTQKEWVETTKQIWQIPVPNKSDSAFGKHSALMPEELARRCIKLFSFAGDVVLDPFTGSGTTLKVAKELDRKFFGYELVDEYVESINEKVGSSICVKRSRKRTAPVVGLPGQVPTRFLNTVVESDVFDFLKRIPRHSIDLACIDPPYNLGKGDWDTFRSEFEFLTFSRAWIDAVIPTLKPGGSLYIFNTPRNCALILAHLENRGLQFENWITWDKRDGFSSSRKKFVPMQESILYYSIPGADKTFNSDQVRVPYESESRIAAAATRGILKDGKRWYPNPGGKMCTDVWHISSERHKNKVEGRLQKSAHPTPKPLELIERIIRASSNEGDIVLDCFAGTGTTAVAAIGLERGFVGCDSASEYVVIANERISAISK